MIHNDLQLHSVSADHNPSSRLYMTISVTRTALIVIRIRRLQATRMSVSVSVVSAKRRRISDSIYVFVTRLYLFFFAVPAMAYWRGVWLLVDYYLSDVKPIVGCSVGLVVCYALLLVLKSSRTLIFPPFLVSLDTRRDLLVPSTRFQTKVSFRYIRHSSRYCQDAGRTLCGWPHASALNRRSSVAASCRCKTFTESAYSVISL